MQLSCDIFHHTYITGGYTTNRLLGTSGAHKSRRRHVLRPPKSRWQKWNGCGWYTDDIEGLLPKGILNNADPHSMDLDLRGINLLSLGLTMANGSSGKVGFQLGTMIFKDGLRPPQSSKILKVKGCMACIDKIGPSWGHRWATQAASNFSYSALLMFSSVSSAGSAELPKNDPQNLCRWLVMLQLRKNPKV